MKRETVKQRDRKCVERTAKDHGSYPCQREGVKYCSDGKFRCAFHFERRRSRWLEYA